MSEVSPATASKFPAKLGFGVGVALILVGVGVFLIRLQHAGPYGMPAGGNLRAALFAFVLGSFLVRPERVLTPVTSALRWVALVGAPIVLFFALYATLAELEEVIVVEAKDGTGESVGLRLWVVDIEGAEWVLMPRAKAEEYALDGARLDRLRQGETRCVQLVLSSDPETAQPVLDARNEKYAVQRLAMAIGLFGRELTPNTVVLRLDECTPDETARGG